MQIQSPEKKCVSEALPWQVGLGWQMLLRKEILRFWKVSAQTITAPILTALMYLLVFHHVMEDHAKMMYGSVSYTAFLIPGLVMMSLLQNAFANSSSSLVQSKMMGNLIFLQLTPLSHWHWFFAYVGAAVIRGLAVGLGVFAATVWFAKDMQFAQPWWILIFAFLGAGLLASIGLIAGLWSDRFEQMSTFQNFFIMPLTFLSGVFYSIHSLPAFWQELSKFNPFFYLIDGFRSGFFGHADVSPWLSFAVVLTVFVLFSTLALEMLRRGYKVRQ